MDMSILTIFVPLICMFAAAWKFGKRLSAAAGISISVLSMASALVPPPGYESLFLFESKLIGGIVLLSQHGRFRSRSVRVHTQLDSVHAIVDRINRLSDAQY